MQAYEEWFELVLGPDQAEDGGPDQPPSPAREEAWSVEPVPS